VIMLYYRKVYSEKRKNLMKKLAVHSPYDNHLIQEISQHSAEEAKQMLANAATLFQKREKWLTKAKRIEILEKIAELVNSRQEALAQLATEEGGKPLIDSRVEAARAVSSIKVAIQTLATMTGEEIPMQVNSASLNRIAFTLPEPCGVVLAISAFNHPLNLIVHQVIPAIAVGCPVIVKPALKTPLSCLKLVNILYEAGLPKEWCQVVICANEITEQLVSDSRISFLTFIGSSKVGWMLRAKLPPGAACSLEHGGSAPVIIETDADLQDAIPLLVKGGFYHAGQVCVSVKRVFAHVSICEKIANEIAAKAQQLVVGDPMNDKTEVGPLISLQEINRVDEWVQEAIAAGAKLLCGGKKISATCYQPTVLLNPPESVRVSQEEVFGPVICIYSYNDRFEAIERANKPFFCFQAAIFTKNIDVALDTANRLNATTVLVNDHTAFRVDWMPFGGRKSSGLDMGGIPYAMHSMSANKMLVIRSKVL